MKDETMSETASCRTRLAPFCIGHNGIDVGAGGDPIVSWAICIDRDEGDGRRAHVGQHPTHLVGDATNLPWFQTDSLDWVYSSHVLEDFEDTSAVLAEWLRVIKPGGNLILFLPDQPTYVAHCEHNGSLPNQAHKHPTFSLAFVKKALAKIGYSEADIVHQKWPVFGNPYSFDLVIRKKA